MKQHKYYSSSLFAGDRKKKSGDGRLVQKKSDEFIVAV